MNIAKTKKAFLIPLSFVEKKVNKKGLCLVELRRIELLAYALRTRRSPS